MPLRLIHFLLFCLPAITDHAQRIDERNFALYTTKDGLSNNYINAIVQDAYGYLWLGTRKGLNRFDGNSFKQFYSDSSKYSLPQDGIRSLKMLDKEQLAVLTLSGLHIVNTKTLKQRNLIIPPDSLKSLLPLNSVFDVTGDKKGNVFAITRTGFYQFNNKDELVFRYDHFSQKQVETGPTQFGWEIILADDTTVLLSAAKGLYIYNIAQKNLHLVNKSDNELYQQIIPTPRRFWFAHDNEVSFSVVYYDQKEFIWFDKVKKSKQVITDSVPIVDNLRQESSLLQLNDSFFIVNAPISGFYGIHYDRVTGQYMFEDGPYFKDQLCLSLFIDKKNNIWMGTSEGLLRQKRPTAAIEKVTMPAQGNSLDNIKAVNTIAVAHDKIFTGSNLGDLLVFHRDSLKWMHRIEGIAQKNLKSIIPYNSDTVIIGFPGLLLNTKTLKSTLLDLPVMAQGYHIYSNHQNIYINPYNSDSFYVRKANGTEFTLHTYKELSKIRGASEMSEDNEGNLWFAGQGIMRFNKQSQTFDLLLDSFPAIKVAKKNIVSNLVFDNQGNLYAGVGDNGLIIYDSRQNKFSHLTRSDGLPDNVVRRLFIHDNILWIGTEAGLASYDLATKRISAFDISDGITVDGAGITSFYYDSVHGQLYFGVTNQVYRFNPGQFRKNNSPPDFFIESINVSGRHTIYHPDSTIHLPYKHNNIVLHLGSINFEDAYLQNFAYRVLKRGDESWNELGSQRSIMFNNLSAGEHRIQVKVYTRNNSWAEQLKEITITVRSPFWKTIWFYLVIGLLIAVFFYYLHKRKIQRVKQKVNIDKQLTELELKGLHAQMNPHFIFNCLNSIREMILNNENPQASHYLSKFAQLIRITLNQSSKQFITLEGTIDYLQRYIEMEKIRNDKFNYTIDVDERLQTHEIMIHPMLIQPFIENAIWHGTVPGKHLDVKVRFMKSGQQLVCYIEDNGPGIETTMNSKKEMHVAHTSIGIANVKERIRVLNEKYNLNSELKIEDRSKEGKGIGTVVQLYVPLKSITA